MNEYNTLQNLHTHSTYCDGIDTIEEMIVSAYNQGFGSIGLSSHSLMKKVSMPKEKLKRYKEEIAGLKIKYADKIDVFCGIECEMRSNIDKSGFDYLLGAVHYLKSDEELLMFDVSDVEFVKGVIRTNFGGDGMAYAKSYYSELGKLPEFGKFDIVAHFDLIAKFCEKERLFDVTSKEYRWAAIEAAEKIAGKIPYFEVNMGTIIRGFRSTPYPDAFLMPELKRLGFGAIITSDCHDSRKLACGLKEGEEWLKQYGFKEKYILTKNGFVPVEI